MSEEKSPQTRSDPQRRPQQAGVGRGLATAICSFLGLGAIMVLYVMGLAACKPPTGGAQSLASLAHGAMAKLQAPAEAASFPTAPFVDGEGKSVTLSKFKGRAVVLNLWATWCGPCVKEMPTLAKLQSEFAGQPLSVVALSTDSPKQADAAKAFIAKHPPLAFYQDVNLSVVPTIVPRVEGFPTTLLYDRQGRLKGVVSGDVDWASPDAKAVADALLQ